jgi:hypothetical protein
VTTTTEANAPHASRNLAWAWAALTFALFVAGAVMSALSRTDVDIAWLLTMGEKMLAGQRPYVDMFEANPPMSILLYLPAVLAGHGLGVSPDAMVKVLVLAACAGSLALCARIVAPITGGRTSLWKLAAAGAFVLTVLPTGVFGQREHIAVVAMLPFLATTIARGQGRPPAVWIAALAGIGCGLAMAIKPHFALIAGGALLVTAWRLRSIRPLVALEVWAASAVVGLYALVVVVFFPAFLSFLPVIRSAYLPVRQPLGLLLLWPPAIAWLIVSVLAALVARTRPGAGWPTASLLAASAGGFASYLIQGKGWPYHSYPMLALASLALGAAACFGAPQIVAAGETVGRRTARIGFACAGLMFAIGATGASMRWFTLKGDYHALNAPVAAIAARPRLLAITADIAVGHPLTRELHGHWVGSVCSQWISAGALTLEHRGGLSPAQHARLDSLMALDRRLLTHDIVVGRPDVILISTNRDWIGWAMADPGLATALSAYKPVETVQGVAIWAHK